MRSAFISIGCGFVGALLFQIFSIQFMNQTRSQSQSQNLNLGTVNATRYDLVDSSGNLRGQFGFAKEGPPGFWLMDEKGMARIMMGLYPDGTAHFGLQDRNGMMIQLMRSIGPSESPLLIFKNKGQDKMILGLNSSKAEPFFIMHDKDQIKKIQAGFADGP
jgi:hypothetical protein